MSQETLRPDGRPVELEELGFVVVSRNLSARMEALPGSTPGVRSGGQGFTAPVMKSADMREMGTVILEDAHPERDEEKSVELHVPAGGREDGRLLLYFDENGAVTFHLPQAEERPPAGVRAGGKMLRFEVPIRKPVKEEAAAPTRGIGGMAARKVFKVLGWKVAGAAAAQYGPRLVRRWENAHRPTRVVDRAGLFEPGAPARADLIPPAERTLLLVHGTFSRVASGFKGLDSDDAFLTAIDDAYGNSIYGFDHATVATGVATNVMQFYEKLAPGRHNIDIICHSRGGLVARALRDLSEQQLKERFALDAERGRYEDELKAWGQAWRIPAGVEVNVNCILFGGTPNQGTVLAQPAFLQKYLELLMTASNLLPEVADVTVDAILSVAKILLSEVMFELPGLDDQKPGSSLLELLQDSPGPRDAAIQADYRPPTGLQALMRTADALVDRIFQRHNDLVVPNDSTSRWPEGSFEPDRLLAFAADKSVWHSSLFLQAETRQRMRAWLAA
ncbi:MAG: hypothetical protein ACE5H9_15950 [Anaerolineae bacterium]